MRKNSKGLEATTNFVQWNTVASPILGTAAITAWSTNASKPLEFFRIGRN